MNFAQAKEKFGSVNFGGVEYAMTEAAYMDNYGTDGEVCYYASAINHDGAEFLVTYETTAAWDAANAVAQAEMRGEEPDLEAISEEHGVEIDEFENIDLTCEEYACNWDRPIDVKPAD